jgi:rhodanese-related sulfurtransferase
MTGGCGPNNLQAPPDWQALRQEIRTRFPSVETISTAELAAWLQRAATVRPLLLDARAPAEFAVSHLPDAILASTAAGAAEIIQAHPHRVPVVVYCSVGYRSADMAARLQAQGFTNILNLEGSIFQWANEGRPVFRGTTAVRVVHPFDEVWGRYLQRERWMTGTR